MKTLREILLTPESVRDLQVKDGLILTGTVNTIQIWTRFGACVSNVESKALITSVQLLNRQLFCYSIGGRLTTNIVQIETGQTHVLDQQREIFSCKGVLYCKYYQYVHTDYMQLAELTPDFVLKEPILSICEGYCVWLPQKIVAFGLEKHIRKKYRKDRFVACVVSDQGVETLFTDWKDIFFSYIGPDSLVLYNQSNRCVVSDSTTVIQNLDRLNFPPLSYLWEVSGCIIDIYNQQWNPLTYTLFGLMYRQCDANMLLSLTHSQMVNLCADQLGWS